MSHLTARAISGMNAGLARRSAPVHPRNALLASTLVRTVRRNAKRIEAMKTLFRNAALGAAALAAVAAGSVAETAPARANDKVAGALLGGLVAGALIGSLARPVYAAPVYATPVYAAPVYRAPVYAQPAYPVAGPNCYRQRRTVWDPYYGRYVVQKIKTCY
jgi:hypothetical protein